MKKKEKKSPKANYGLVKDISTECTCKSIQKSIDALQEAKRQYYKEGKIFSSAMPLPGYGNAVPPQSFLDCCRKMRVFALVADELLTGRVCVIQFSRKPSTLRRVKLMLLRESKDCMPIRDYYIIPFEVPRYYFQ